MKNIVIIINILLLFISNCLSAQVKVDIEKKVFRYDEKNVINVDNLSSKTIFYVVSAEFYHRNHWQEFNDNISTSEWHGSTDWKELKANRKDSFKVVMQNMLGDGEFENYKKMKIRFILNYFYYPNSKNKKKILLSDLLLIKS